VIRPENPADECGLDETFSAEGDGEGAGRRSSLCVPVQEASATRTSVATSDVLMRKRRHEQFERSRTGPSWTPRVSAARARTVGARPQLPAWVHHRRGHAGRARVRPIRSPASPSDSSRQEHPFTNGEASEKLGIPETGAVQALVDAPGIAPSAMALGPHSVWVLDYHGTLTRIELR
jgi:hypothetical protein